MGRAYNSWILNLLVHHVTSRLQKVKIILWWGFRGAKIIRILKIPFVTSIHGTEVRVVLKQLLIFSLKLICCNFTSRQKQPIYKHQVKSLRLPTPSRHAPNLRSLESSAIPLWETEISKMTKTTNDINLYSPCVLPSRTLTSKRCI